MVKDGIDRTSVEGAAEPALRDPEPAGRPAHAEARRAGAVVALGRLARTRPTRPRRSSTSSRAAGEQGSGRVPPRAARQASAAPGGAEARGREGRLGQAARRQGRRSAGAASRCTSRSAPYVAQVAEVSVDKDGTFKVDRVVCAVDCGIAVNPDNVTRADGRRHRLRPVGGALRRDHAARTASSSSRTSTTTRLLRINEMPKVEVHIVPSTASPDRRRRARRAADRAGGRQRDRRRHRQARCARCR